MLEAMSAGLVCVHPNTGALPETSGGLNLMYNFDENKSQHASNFINYLNASIAFVKENQELPMISFNKTFADSRFNIERIKNQWEVVLKELLGKYPTIESRGMPKQMFTYKV
jgi:hypothetical protein